MLYDKLKRYSEIGVYPFHMPGHKRNNVNGDSTIPYKIDLTEISGFDNLHSPNGCIKAVEEKAAELYSANRAFMLVNGATGGILAAAKAMTKRGDKVLIARNCHKSVYNAVELCGLNPKYLVPDPVTGNKNYNIYGGINPFLLEMYLSKNSDTKLVIITSPTYEGICSDVESIARICHSFGARLLVDEAHGAHFPFHSAFPKSAINCGADVTVVSLHKTLPALTQTALLLTNDNRLEQTLQSNLAVFETSSPSYVLMSSVERCLDFISANPQAFDDYVNNLRAFSKSVEKLSKIKVLFRNREEEPGNLYDVDIGKIVISMAETSLTGKELADILRREYKIEIEMSACDYVIAMTSVCDSKEGFERLARALDEIDRKCGFSKKENQYRLSSEVPVKSFNPCERFNYNQKKVDFDRAEGKASFEYITAYPPGIPLIVPGEIISADLIKSIKTLSENRIEINSSENTFPNLITVAEL